MFGNGDGPPTIARSSLPSRDDHPEFQAVVDRASDIEDELSELRRERERLLEKLADPREREERTLEDVLAGAERASATQALREEEKELRDRIRALEADRERLRAERRANDVGWGREVLEADEEVQATYRQIVDHMHSAACELARWADAEQELRDELGNNGIPSAAALDPCSFPAAQVNRRRNSPMIRFLELCRERHGLEPTGGLEL